MVAVQPLIRLDPIDGAEWHEQARRAVDFETSKPARRDADHMHGLIANADHTSHNAWVGTELETPEALGQHGDQRRARAILLLAEETPGRGAQAEDVEEVVVREDHAARPCWIARALDEERRRRANRAPRGEGHWNDVA